MFPTHEYDVGRPTNLYFFMAVVLVGISLTIDLSKLMTVKFFLNRILKYENLNLNLDSYHCPRANLVSIQYGISEF